MNNDNNHAYNSKGDIMISYNQELQLHAISKIPAFEGWYFRIVDKKISIAIIIGIAKTKNKQEVFIQVFHTLTKVMEKVSYDIKEFQYQEDPFTIVLNKSIIKRHYIHIEDSRLSTEIDLRFNMPQHIKQTLYAPTIMGPFAYIRGMQCHHAIINLGSPIYGWMRFQKQYYDIQGILYQEKDWGCSFPKKYIWIQSNCCIQRDAVLFLSCATIPLKVFHFTGVIVVMKIEGKEYRFASYYGARVIKNTQEKETYHLHIKQGKYLMKLEIKMSSIYILDAPKDGLMLRNVEECLLGETKITLYEYKQCLEVLTFQNCGIEHDHFFK